MSRILPKPGTEMPDTTPPPAAQIGALCYREVGGALEIMLITSRDTGRWVIPKGWPIKGLEPHEAAAREAFEEAGIKGKVEAQSLGSFDYAKKFKDAPDRPCRVAVFSLLVEQVLDSFPEASQRRRRWFRQTKAATKVQEPELQALLAAFDPTASTR